MSPLIATLTEVFGLTQPLLLAGFVVFLRVGAAISVMPAFGEQSLPTRIRLALALAFTLIVAPAVMGADPEGRLPPLALLTEPATGLVLGLGLRFFIFALQTAGMMIAQSTSLSQLFGGTAGEPQAVMGNFLTVAALALAVTSGLHVRMAELLIHSYALLPVGKMLAAPDLAEWGVLQVGRTFSLAFSLALPFVIAALLYNLALGIVNRAMPALAVSFIGAPALTLGGLILFALAAPLLLAHWHGAFLGFLADPFAP